MFIEIIEGKAVISEQGLAQPYVQKVYKLDKTRGKKVFDMWMRFVYFSYSKDSIYRNYLPKEREINVVNALFPDKTVTYFKKITGMGILIERYIDLNYTFKEKLYRRLLHDIEEMQESTSLVPLTKTVRVKEKKEVTFFSIVEEQEVTEIVMFDIRITIDNSVKKLIAIDTLEKLLIREGILKKKLKEEQIEMSTAKQQKRRMFDE